MHSVARDQVALRGTGNDFATSTMYHNEGNWSCCDGKIMTTDDWIILSVKVREEQWKEALYWYLFHDIKTTMLTTFFFFIIVFLYWDLRSQKPIIFNQEVCREWEQRRSRRRGLCVTTDAVFIYLLGVSCPGVPHEIAEVRLMEWWKCVRYLCIPFLAPQRVEGPEELSYFMTSSSLTLSRRRFS